MKSIKNILIFTIVIIFTHISYAQENSIKKADDIIEIAKQLDSYYSSIVPISFSFSIQGNQPTQGECIYDGKYFWIKQTENNIPNTVDGKVITEFVFGRNTSKLYNGAYIIFSDGYKPAVKGDSDIAVISKHPSDDIEISISAALLHPELFGLFPVENPCTYLPDFLRMNCKNTELFFSNDRKLCNVIVNLNDYKYSITINYIDRDHYYVKTFSVEYTGDSYKRGTILSNNFTFTNIQYINDKVIPQTINYNYSIIEADPFCWTENGVVS